MWWRKSSWCRYCLTKDNFSTILKHWDKICDMVNIEQNKVVHIDVNYHINNNYKSNMMLTMQYDKTFRIRPCFLTFIIIRFNVKTQNFHQKSPITKYLQSLSINWRYTFLPQRTITEDSDAWTEQNINFGIIQTPFLLLQFYLVVFNVIRIK